MARINALHKAERSGKFQLAGMLSPSTQSDTVRREGGVRYRKFCCMLGSQPVLRSLSAKAANRKFHFIGRVKHGWQLISSEKKLAATMQTSAKKRKPSSIKVVKDNGRKQNSP